MNRADWEAQIYASDLSPTARLVAGIVGTFGNWTESRNVWPSTKAVADMAGMTRGTTQKYIDALVEHGWLRLVKVRKNNVKEYELCSQVVESSGILAKPQRGNQFNRLSDHSTTYDTPTYSRLSNQATQVVESSNFRLSNQASQVVESPDTNLKEPTSKNLEEPSNTTPVPDRPVVEDEVREGPRGSIFLNHLEKQEVQRWCRAYRHLHLNEEEMIEAVGLEVKEGMAFDEALDLHLNKKGVSRDEW